MVRMPSTIDLIVIASLPDDSGKNALAVCLLKALDNRWRGSSEQKRRSLTFNLSRYYDACAYVLGIQFCDSGRLMQEVLDAPFGREIDASRISWLEEVMGKLRKFQQWSLEVLRYWYPYGDGSLIGRGCYPSRFTLSDTVGSWPSNRLAPRF